MADQRLIFRRGTKAALEAKLRGDNKPLAGEPIYELPDSTSTVVAPKMKIGDGAHDYVDLKYIAEDGGSGGLGTIYEAPCVRGGDHMAAIATVCTNPKRGDIAIVHELINDADQSKGIVAHYQYTAYIYDKSWIALDGNYDADNVYLAQDITLAGNYTSVGNITKELKETKTLAAKGKSVNSILTEIFSKRLAPTIETPVSISMSGTKSNLSKEVGTTITQSGSITTSFNPGKYTYEPPTGVTVTKYVGKVQYTKGKTEPDPIAESDTSSIPSYSYSFQLTDEMPEVNVKFSYAIQHTAGAVAKDNLGTDTGTPEAAPYFPKVQIEAVPRTGVEYVTTSSTASYTCFRNMFYGTKTVKAAELVSSDIRSLVGVEKAAKKTGNSLIVNIPLGALRTIIAVPSTYSVTSVQDENASKGEIFDSFVKQTISVEGAEGYTGIDYNVYVLDVAKPNDKANRFFVTIA